MHYKKRFYLGVFFALITAVLNAISLAAFIPIFDSLGAPAKEAFQLKLTRPELGIIYKEKIMGPNSLDGLERTKKLLIDFKEYINKKTIHMEPREVVWTVSILILPIYILKLGAMLTSVWCIATTGYRAVRDIRKQLFGRVQSLPLTYFYKEKTGLIMSRMVNDVETIAAVISSNLRDATINFFYVITHVLILLYLNTNLLIVAALTVPIVVMPVTLFTKKITKYTARSQERMAELNGNLQETISGIKVIRSFVMEKFELGKFQKINNRLASQSFKGQFYLQIAPSLVELTSSVVVLGFFALGAKFMATGQFTQGEFMAFLLTLLFLLRPLTQLSQMVGRISQANVAGGRIFDIIDMDGEKLETGTKSLIKPIQKSISFKNVYFLYPGTSQDVLKNINLEVRAGETIALVGASGSGKSTLMDLIPRFFDPVSGKIEFDGIDIKNFHLSEIRKKIGIVTQDIFLFHGTVADNISYGVEKCTRKDVIRASRLANAHDFITKLDKGYDNMIGVRGMNLSGGQRQRLVIARALLRNPEILILDEATSALDAESEKYVNQAIDRLIKNRTTFIIAHRLSTIRKIKKIIVMDNGNIVETGDHESLLAKNGFYKKLYDHQFVTADIL